MYWFVALSIIIGGAIIAWLILSHKWQRLINSNDSFSRVFTLQTIHFARTFNPSLPGDPNYLDLKFSVIRHALVSLISAIIIYFLNGSGIVVIILLINMLHTALAVQRYSARKKMIPNIINETSTKEEMKVSLSLINDSCVVVVYSIIVTITLYVLLFISFN